MIVVEIQAGDTVATLVTHHDDNLEAESKYHQILQAAALSNVAKHSAVMLTDEGFYVKSEVYKH